MATRKKKDPLQHVTEDADLEHPPILPTDMDLPVYEFVDPESDQS